MRVANGTAGMSEKSNCKISNENIYLRFHKMKTSKNVFKLSKVCINILLIVFIIQVLRMV